MTERDVFEAVWLAALSFATLKAMMALHAWRHEPPNKKGKK